MNDSTFTVSGDDAAFIWRGDGSTEVIIPNTDDVEKVSDSTLFALAVAILMNGKPESDAILQQLYNLMETYTNQPEEEKL